MKTYFGYIRVSTVRQGERGSSLQEQKSAIQAYAARSGLRIGGWFEEMETAATQGRRIFNRMLAELEGGRAHGVIIHKIDRSARNLKDWAHLGELIDAGVDVHFAHESLDLQSRGGRLSADIQAVVAADYIRNLRDEVKKGFYGRLKQGFYPLPAPIGYVDCGKAKPKEIDPASGPLVRQTFELYATGDYSIEALHLEMIRRGLRCRTGKAPTRSTLGAMLHNPFYMGRIRIGTTGELFDGVHEPIVSRALFRQVQAVAAGRLAGARTFHAYAYRRLIACECGRILVGELQKGRVYYRCHNRACSTSLREDHIDHVLGQALCAMALDEGDLGEVRAIAASMAADIATRQRSQQDALRMQLGQCETRFARLTDALIDGLLDRVSYDERKGQLDAERRRILEALEAAEDQPSEADRLIAALELARTAQERFHTALAVEKRDIAKSICSNFTARGKTLHLSLCFPFDDLIGPISSDTVAFFLFMFERACIGRRVRVNWEAEHLYKVPQVPKVHRSDTDLAMRGAK